MIRGLSALMAPGSAPSDTYMEELLLKLQAEVAARKHPRTDLKPLLRIGALVAFTFAFAFAWGSRTAEANTAFLPNTDLHERLATANADLAASRAEVVSHASRIERLERAYDLSARYAIAADLAIDIHDTAVAENVDPQLAFELVRVESRFNPRAVSPVGALGLTQLMPATARILSPGISRQQIFERETNLRLGFRFFRSLLTYYGGDVRLALLAYNRGPTTVDRLLIAGLDPGNGYARAVMEAIPAPAD